MSKSSVRDTPVTVLQLLIYALAQINFVLKYKVNYKMYVNI